MRWDNDVSNKQKKNNNEAFNFIHWFRNMVINLNKQKGNIE